MDEMSGKVGHAVVICQINSPECGFLCINTLSFLKICPIWLVCLQAAACGSTQVLNILRKAGAQVNVRNASGLTPLAYAAGRGQAQLVSALISMGCHVDTRSQDGTTPLHQAATAGNQVDLKLLYRQAEPLS